MATISGAQKIRARLAEIAKQARNGDVLKVGFMADATYPDGTPVAYVAAIQEFGGTFTVPERTTTIYRKLNKDGQYAKGGRFVKKPRANVATEHVVPSHTVTIPARPFFRTMIANESPQWGEALGRMLAANDYDVKVSFGQLGEIMVGQLQQSILSMDVPPNAPSTVARKGFNKPLIDTGLMLKSVTAKVESGA